MNDIIFSRSCELNKNYIKPAFNVLSSFAKSSSTQLSDLIVKIVKNVSLFFSCIANKPIRIDSKLFPVETSVEVVIPKATFIKANSRATSTQACAQIKEKTSENYLWFSQAEGRVPNLEALTQNLESQTKKPLIFELCGDDIVTQHQYMTLAKKSGYRVKLLTLGTSLNVSLLESGADSTKHYSYDGRVFRSIAL